MDLLGMGLSRNVIFCKCQIQFPLSLKYCDLEHFLPESDEWSEKQMFSDCDWESGLFYKVLIL